jgi:hypothetical protein
VAIPAFDGRGFLPPFLGTDETTPARSPYDATMSELVVALGTTAIRQNILFGLLKYRALLASFGYINGIQFIDGSFVENVETRESRDPGDIDVFSFLMQPAQYVGNVALWRSTGFPQFQGEVVNQALNKLRYHSDTYGIVVDQGGPLQMMDATIYWYSLFSHKKVTHDWKGFIKVPLNPADDQLALASIVSGA